MPALYLDRRGADIHLDRGCLKIQAEGQPPESVPLNLIERVVVSAPARISSALLIELAGRGVPLILVARNQSHPAAVLSSNFAVDGQRRIDQYAAYLAPARRIRVARSMLRSKLLAQCRALAFALRERPDRRFELNKARAAVHEAIGQLKPDSGMSLSALLGIEGAAARSYFEAYAGLFAPGLEFEGRNRRPPRDPVNVCLSLGYTLMHAAAVQAAVAAGLDPFIGFFHGLEYGRESLACDLVEPERARVDAWVWRCFRDRVLRPEHFHRLDDACMLGKAGRAEFYTHFEPLLGIAARRQRRRCRWIVRTLAAWAKERTDHEEALISGR